MSGFLFDYILLIWEVKGGIGRSKSVSSLNYVENTQVPNMIKAESKIAKGKVMSAFLSKSDANAEIRKC